MKKEIDLNDLVKRMKRPYKIGVNLCLILIFLSLGMSLVSIRSSFCFYYLSSSFLLLFLALFLRKKLKDIEDKIYLWGAEDAWNYFRGKKRVK